MQIFLCVQCISGRALSKTSFLSIISWQAWKKLLWYLNKCVESMKLRNLVRQSLLYSQALKLGTLREHSSYSMLDPNILAFYGSASTSEPDSRLAPQDSDPKRGSKKDQCPLWSAFDPNERVCSKMNRRFRKLICKYLFAKYVFEVTVRKKLVSPKMTHHSVLYTAFTRIINTFIPYV